MKTTSKTTTTTNEKYMILEYNKALLKHKELTLKASMTITQAKIKEMEDQYKEFYKDYVLTEDN